MKLFSERIRTGIGTASLVDSPINDESDESGWRTKDYEDSLQNAGFGKMQLLLALVCGLAYAAAAIEVLCMTFALPFVSCVFQLDSTQTSVVQSVAYFGMLIGSYLGGYVGDRVGRRSVISGTQLLFVSGGLVSSVCQSYTSFLMFRLVSGIGVGGSIPVIFSYFAEFQPRQHRGKMIIVVTLFWMLGNMMCAGLAWTVLPSNTLSQHWRLFIAGCTFPAIITAVTVLFLPESPKYLICKGKEDQCLEVLSLVFHINTGQHKHLYPVHSILLETYQEKKTLLPKSGNRFSLTRVKLHAMNLLVETGALFVQPLTRRTVVLLVQMFTLSFGYYGLSIWLRAVISNIHMTGGGTGPCSLTIVNATSLQNATSSCSDLAYVSAYTYRDTLMSSLSSVPGTVLAISLVDCVGRKILLVGSMLVSGVVALLMFTAANEWQTVAMMCVFNGISVIGWNVLDVLLAELYPTDKRCLAFGVNTSMGRSGAILGNVLFSQLVDNNCAITLLLVSFLMIFGGIFAVFLPTMQHKPLE